MTEILMSIHHRYAELIYSGEKTVELRKTAPKALDGDGLKVYLYDTKLKSITGVVYVKFIHEITEIGPKLLDNSCLNLEEIEVYRAKGKGKLYAWEICGVDEYGPDWLLPEDLRAQRAPQAWQYVR